MRTLHLSPKSIAVVLAVIAASLSAIHIGLTVFAGDFNASLTEGWLARLNLNAEISIPTWYSQTLLFVAAVLTWLVGWSSRNYQRHWYVLSGVVLFLSIDEGSGFHELVSAPTRQLLGIDSGYLFYAWIIVYGVLLIILAIVFLKFWLALQKATRWLLAAAAAVYVTGAIGFEVVGAGIASASNELTVGYSLAAAAEETLEMLGVVILIYALANHLRLIKVTTVAKFGSQFDSLEESL